MKHYLLLLFWCLLAAHSGLAQPTTIGPSIRRSDLIFRNDKAVLETQIEQLLPDRIRYRLIAAPNGAIREILLENVAKIRFANGSERIYSPTSKPLRETPTPKPVREVDQAPLNATYMPSALVRELPKRPFLVLTFGGDGSYMLGSASWIADSTRTGFRYGVGGSAGLDVHLTRWMAVSLRCGLNRYVVERRFITQEGTVAFRTTTTFQQIPIQIGIKLYPFQGCYVMPQAGLQLLTYTYQDGTPLSEQATSQRLAFGGSIGTEFGGRVLWFDLSATYNVVQVRSLGPSFASVGPVQYAGLRLGIGFMVRK